MRGFMWGILFTATVLVALMSTGILSVRYNGVQTTAANTKVIRPVTLAQVDKSDPQIKRLPEIRVLSKDEGR